MAMPVRSDLVTASVHLARQAGIRSHPLAEAEERRPHAERVEAVEHRRGVGRVRTVVERQRDPCLRRTAPHEASASGGAQRRPLPEYGDTRQHVRERGRAGGQRDATRCAHVLAARAAMNASAVSRMPSSNGVVAALEPITAAIAARGWDAVPLGELLSGR